jgi:hypothetical protein
MIRNRFHVETVSISALRDGVWNCRLLQFHNNQCRGLQAHHRSGVPAMGLETAKPDHHARA